MTNGVDAKAALLNVVHQVDALFTARAEQNHAPATAYGIIYQGELIYANSLGVLNIKTAAPVINDAVFRIASMTKSFAAAAILQLRDAGKLQLDTPFTAYVPELAHIILPTNDSAPITGRQLLTMAAGFPQDDPWADRQLYRDDASLTETYKQGVTFSSPPDTRFEYSNLGYMLLGRIITNISGQPALAYMSQQLITPLGMNDTVWNAEEVAAERLAHPYHWLDEMLISEPLLPSAGDNAAFAGLFTTVPDLARWVSFFLDAWPARDGADGGPLSRSSRREMQRIWNLASPTYPPYALGDQAEFKSSGYGMGLSINHDGQYPIVGHGGGLPGYGSYMCWSPRHQLGVVGLANVRYAGVSKAASAALKLLVAEAKPPAYVPKASAHLQQAATDVTTLMHRWDDVLADRIFADNFFLDQDRPHWRERLAKLRDVHGGWTKVAAVSAENWLRGSWTLRGERGHCQLWLSMNPTNPPQIQALRIKSILPPSERMAERLAQIVALVNRPDKTVLGTLCADQDKVETFWKRLQIAHLLAAPATLGEQIAGNGTAWTTHHLNHEGGSVRLVLRLDDTGNLTVLRLEHHGR